MFSYSYNPRNATSFRQAPSPKKPQDPPARDVGSEAGRVRSSFAPQPTPDPSEDGGIDSYDALPGEDLVTLDYLIGVALTTDHSYSFVQYRPTERHKTKTLLIRVSFADLTELSLESLWMLKGEARLHAAQRRLAIAIDSRSLESCVLNPDSQRLLGPEPKNPDELLMDLAREGLVGYGACARHESGWRGDGEDGDGGEEKLAGGTDSEDEEEDGGGTTSGRAEDGDERCDGKKRTRQSGRLSGEREVCGGSARKRGRLGLEERRLDAHCAYGALEAAEPGGSRLTDTKERPPRPSSCAQIRFIRRMQTRKCAAKNNTGERRRRLRSACKSFGGRPGATPRCSTRFRREKTADSSSGDIDLDRRASGRCLSPPLPLLSAPTDAPLVSPDAEKRRLRA
ncbi:hypothetical protein Q5P01_000752 [Channa striata]|uniref:Uncharacterized protein n=1 Tax=Channa striata TaxID=64152 RepID=A0AA88LIV9_CHASR|nr:hypothetical protein Q5P01_000752 [Channa striata]